MKINKFLILIISVVFLTACNSEEKSGDITSYNTDGLYKAICTRDAVVEDDETEISINYELYYDDNEYIQILNSKEEITSTNQELLTTYENAYKNIYKAYEDLEYYENKITREDNTLTSTTSINYGKIDMDKLIEIEGEEDNVKITNGRIKLSDWKSFAKKYGATCDD